MADSQTIFALASGAGRAAIAVMRLSGPGCSAILRGLCGPLPPARMASLRKVRDLDKGVLDQAVVLWFPAPASYTGQDCAELHLHGSLAVVASVADTLVRMGARPAEPGEFTRRAFLHGKMDLVEAEAVADLVDAETDGQRRQALLQLEGGLSRIYEGWATRLRQVLAWQEALIDFSTEDLPPETDGELLAEVAALHAEITRHLDDGRRGERLRTGLTFVIAGQPNAGKSSLINYLSDREVAIVAPTAGTTRDAIEVRINLGGVPVTLVDTAGLRDATDTVEAEGVRRARAHIAAADLVVLVRDASLAELDVALPTKGPMLTVFNKIDLAPAAPGALAVSARTGDGMDALRDALSRHAMELTTPGGGPPLTRARHRAALAEACTALAAAAAAPFVDLRGEELRLALRSMGRITGLVGVEDLLGTIFGQFCIGK